MNTYKLGIKSILLWIGCLFVVSGVIFFFAYNWDDMNKFLKLALIYSFIIGSVSINLFSKADSLVSNTSLWVAIVGIGIEWTIFGQIYQTGADSYNMFVVWAIFSAGFVIISTSAINWLTWLLIVNLALSLYMSQYLHLDMNDILAIKIFVNTFSSLALYFTVEKKELKNFKWLLNINLIYLILIFSVLMLAQTIGTTTSYIMLFPLYIIFIYLYTKQDSISVSSIAILSSSIVLSGLSTKLATGEGKFYIAVFIFIVSSSFALKYIIAKVKLLSINYNYLKLPWVAHAVILFSTVMSALGILLVASMLGFITKDTLLVFGFILVATAIVLQSKVSNLNYYYTAFIVLIAGQIGIYEGIALNESLSSIKYLNIELESLVIASVQIPLFFFIKDRLQKVLSIVIFTIALSANLFDSSSYLTLTSFITIYSFFIVWMILYKKEIPLYLKHLQYGVTVSLFILSVMLVSYNHVQADISYLNMIIFKTLISVLLMLVLYSFAKKEDILNLKLISITLITVIVLNFISYVSIAILLLTLHLYKKSGVMAMTSIVLTLFIVGDWYYSLELLLLYKSLYIILAGVTMLTLYYRLTKEEALCKS